MILHHSNPQSVIFEADEIARINRITMARWMNITPDDWDVMTYADQCDAQEVARAMKEIEKYDARRRR